MATGGLLGKESTESALDQLAESDAEFHRHVNVFEQEFADAVSEFVGDGGRLVVFIDDLDRCAPEVAVTVLESLKLFTGDSRCVFVLAMDYDLLSAVAARKFGARAPVDGAAYLEKIVQLPFFLPEVKARCCASRWWDMYARNSPRTARSGGWCESVSARARGRSNGS
ncbi:hypothetical protein E1265_28320 [Streptomyces sp. 8K308]|uniref:KAP family P-loop NTPase fold protein n=1 Tax=Streptomyces sp. 8K308 TaxID=2530388 RepID=UPI001053262D|nr:P-loop NTPase fold protein [Streptomyces sp. 8K308]TDC13231.1 hypothetical protein E1265_28320 [Streptomyces sp. 8K308]